MGLGRTPDGGPPLQPWTYRLSSQWAGVVRSRLILGGSDLNTSSQTPGQSGRAETGGNNRPGRGGGGAGTPHLKIVRVRRAAEEARDQLRSRALASGRDPPRPSARSPLKKRARGSTIGSLPLRVHVFPKIGNRPVAEVTGPVIRDVLLPIWRTKPEVARKGPHADRRRVKVFGGRRTGRRPVCGRSAQRSRSANECTDRRRTNAMPFELVPKLYQSPRRQPETERGPLKLVILTGGYSRSAPVRLLRDEHVKF